MEKKEHGAFLELLQEGIAKSDSFRLRVFGGSMYPFIGHGDIIEVSRSSAAHLKIGDIILYRFDERLCAHRLVQKKAEYKALTFYSKGDMLFSLDQPFFEEQVLGKVAAIEKAGARIDIRKRGWAVANYLIAMLSLFMGSLYKGVYLLTGGNVLGEKGNLFLLFCLRRLWLCLALLITSPLRIFYSLGYFIRKKSSFTKKTYVEEFFKEAGREFYEQRKQIRSYADLIENGLSQYEEAIIRQCCQVKGKALDIGCGAGREAFALAKMGFRVIGVDISQGMIEEARKNAARLNPDVRFMQGNICSLKFKDNSFQNVLLLYGLLELIHRRENRIKALVEAKRVLKPDGIVIIALNTDGYFRYPFKSVIQRLILLSTGTYKKLLLKVLGKKGKSRNALSRGYDYLEGWIISQLARDHAYFLRKKVDRTIGNISRTWKRLLIKRALWKYKGLELGDTYYGKVIIDGQIRDVPLHCYDKNEIIEDIKRAGLRVIEVRTAEEQEEEQTFCRLPRKGRAHDFYVCKKD